MLLHVNLKEDEKLRKEIMALIKGQLRGMTREELRTMVLESIEAEGAKKLSAERIEGTIRGEIHSLVAAGVHDAPYAQDFKKLNRMLNSRILEYLESHPEIMEKALEKVLTHYTGDYIERLILSRVDAAANVVLAKLAANPVGEKGKKGKS